MNVNCANCDKEDNCYDYLPPHSLFKRKNKVIWLCQACYEKVIQRESRDIIYHHPVADALRKKKRL